MRKNIGLYHGKRVDTGEWIDGSLVIWGDGSASIFAPELDSPTWAIVPETAGECSGIPDKTDKLIFEGDILKIIYLCQKPVTAVVEFADGKFTARYSRNGKEHADNLTATAADRYEIIGNIHDNPELLGGDTR